MSQHLGDLIRNNDRPSDNTLQEVKELVSEPWKQLDEINAEISRLEGLVDELKQKRTKVEQSINRYSCILSPIRRVPPDILHTIFEHCLPPHRNPTMSASECPMLLTRTCSTWRTLALASPQLWSRIHIPFRTMGEMHSPHAGYPSISADEVSNILRLRCHAARGWLSRSGECPLSISLSYTLPGVEEPGLDQCSTFLLEIITLFSSRWRALELHVPLEVYIGLETMLSGRLLLNLGQLRASIIGGQTHADLQSSLGLLRSPNLHHVSIVLPYSQAALSDGIFVPGQKITYLSIQSLCTVSELFLFFKSCPNLTHIAFNLLADQLVDTPGGTNVSMQHLTSLWITEYFQSSSLWTNLYDFIQAPRLRYIEYQNNGAFPAYDHLSNTPPSSLLPLIERTPEVNRLAIERFALAPETVARMLHSASLNFVVKLVLKSADAYIGARTPDSFDLRCLIAQKGSNSVDTLLPRLEDFELHTTRASDNTILQFITGRMGTLSHVAILRRVKIVLDRLKEHDGVDVHKLVQARAQETKISMDLVLEYPPPLEKGDGYVDPLSPSLLSDYMYGGVITHTWQFRELGDEEGLQ